jgi:hypothetical protein
MDVYSCRDFDTRSVEVQLMDKLGAYDLQMTDVSDALVYRLDEKLPESYRDPFKDLAGSDLLS